MADAHVDLRPDTVVPATPTTPGTMSAADFTKLGTAPADIGAALDAKAPRLYELPAVCDWYVDSVQGDDGNDGQTPLTPFATIAAGVAAMSAGETIGLARGSHWRETLDLSGLAGAKVVSYGIGELPLLDCSDPIANASFTATTGQSNLYYVTVTTGACAGAHLVNCWEDDCQLIPAYTLALCQSTPGSFWASSTADDATLDHDGTIRLHIHPKGSTNAITNGCAYEWSARANAYLDKSDGAGSIKGVWMRRNFSADGAAAVYGSADRCLFTDGSKHSVIAFEGSRVLYSDFEAGGTYRNYSTGDLVGCNYLVFFDGVGTGKNLTAEGCRFDGSSNPTLVSGIISHVGASGTRGDLAVRNCSFSNMVSPVWATSVMSVHLSGVVTTNVSGVIVETWADTYVSDCTLASTDSRCFSMNGYKYTIRGSSLSSWGGESTLFGAATEFVLENSTVIAGGAGYCFYLNAATPKIRAVHNKMIANTSGCFGLYNHNENVMIDDNEYKYAELEPYANGAYTVSGVFRSIANTRIAVGIETGCSFAPFGTTAKTADYSVVMPTDTNKNFTNAGASDTITLALPAAYLGMAYSAYVAAAEELRLDPNGSEVICLPSTGVPGAAGKYLVASAIGATVKLRCYTAGVWAVESYTGTWTAEGP